MVQECPSCLLCWPGSTALVKTNSALQRSSNRDLRSGPENAASEEQTSGSILSSSKEISQRQAYRVQLLPGCSLQAQVWMLGEERPARSKSEKYEQLARSIVETKVPGAHDECFNGEEDHSDGGLHVHTWPSCVGEGGPEKLLEVTSLSFL